MKNKENPRYCREERKKKNAIRKLQEEMALKIKK